VEKVKKYGFKPLVPPVSLLSPPPLRLIVVTYFVNNQSTQHFATA